MNRKRGVFIILLSLAINFTPIFAQTPDEEKENPPLAVVLRMLEFRYGVTFSYADETTENITVTPPKRNLSFKEALKQLIDATGLNFTLLDEKTIVITPSNNTQTDIISTQNLPEITIQNYLTTGILQNNDGNIIIKPDNFGILPGLIEPDILQTVQALPGILSVDEKISSINVRGGTHDQNLILYDNIRMFQSGHFFGLISVFNPYLTKKVTVVKNGTSARYGDCISSVIDMQFSDAVGKDLKTEIGLNLINVDVFSTIPLSNKTEVQVSVRRSITDAIATPTYNQYLKRIFRANQDNIATEKEDFNFFDLTTKLISKISDTDKFTFNFYAINNDLKYDELPNFNSVNTISNSLTQQNLAIGGTYNKQWHKGLESNIQLYISNYNLNSISKNLVGRVQDTQENEVLDKSLKFNTNKTLNKHLTLSVGYQFSELEVTNNENFKTSESISQTSNSVTTHALYSEGHISSKNKATKLNTGIRLNLINPFNLFLVEPRLQLNQKLTKHLNLEILGEFKSQSISQTIESQADFLGIETRRWELSNNKDIPVLKSKQGSAGFHFRKKKLLLSAEVYLKEVVGITTRSQGFQNQYQLENQSGSYLVRGVDFLINKQFKKISTWLSYSLSKNDYTFKLLNNGNPFPNTKDVRNAINYGITYTNNKLKIALGLNWHSGKPVTHILHPNIIDNAINYDLPNNDNLKSYFRTDCSAVYQFDYFNTKLTFGVSLLNVLNTKNVVNSYYFIDGDNSVLKAENTSLGFTPNVSFRVQF